MAAAEEHGPLISHEYSMRASRAEIVLEARSVCGREALSQT